MLALVSSTDPRWVDVALADLPALLRDHVHCEIKAASNALSLAARVPELPTIARALVTMAKDEIDHVGTMMDVLAARGIALGAPETDDYAADLRKVAAASAKGRPMEPWLLDRLLVGAIIEARSCERFRLLAEGLAARGEAELARLYDELFAVEAGHYRMLAEAAEQLVGEAKARARLAELARAEGDIVGRLGERPTMHG